MLGLVRKRVFQQRAVDESGSTEELGDVLWCLAVTAHTLGVPLSRVAEENEAKLRRKHPNGFSGEAARGPESWSRSHKE